MKKVIITLLCLAIVSGGGFYGYKKYEKKKDSKRVVDVVPIDLLRESYWADESTLDAYVTAGNSQNVYLDSEKLVKELYVGVGDRVKKGDLLLQYDITVIDLELKQKKSQISVIEQQIKEAERELEKYKNLIPSEYAPSDDEPEYPDEPEEPDIPEEPEEPEEPEKPIIIIEQLKDLKQASEIDEEGFYCFDCSVKTKAAKSFIGMLKMTGKKVRLFVRNENEQIIYFWEIDGNSVTQKQINDWTLGDGVEIDDSSVSFDASKADAHGKFKVYSQTNDDELPDDDFTDDDFTDDDFSDDDFTDDDFSDGGEDLYEPEEDGGETDDSENYLYTKAELAKMIKQKEQDIASLKLDKRSAELQYKQSKNRKEDGSVKAEIDGVVVKIGAEASGFEDMDYESDYMDDYDSDEMYGEDGMSGGDNSAYIVIQGDDGICIDINVGELNLYKFTEGTQLTGMSYDTGESFSATVIGVKDEPASYYSYMWNENPNSSTYLVTASINGETSLSVNDWASVTMPSDEEASSGLYLPLHYTRKEGSSYYVMRAGKNGKLEKQYIKTGKIIWGSYIEVKGGISLDDKLCFPYGKDVKEGVKTKESDNVLY
ncbi:MAG: biotin/lipoyl-binding protein [Oscillospiraceae bacterium]